MSRPFDSGAQSDFGIIGVEAEPWSEAEITLSNLAVSQPRIFSTAEWGARPPNKAVAIRNQRPAKIVIHHTATPNTGNFSVDHAFQLSRAIQRHHQDTNSWIDSGQHFTISRGGFILEGRHRSLETARGGVAFVAGAHAKGPCNPQSIGIENEGTYIQGGPTEVQWQALVSLCAWLCKQYGVQTQSIVGHRQCTDTTCPGDAFFARLPQLRQAVGARLAAIHGDLELRAELEVMRAALAADRQVAEVAIKGPRLSNAMIEAQEIPLTGLFTRSGKAEIQMGRPTVEATVGVKGRVGTDVEFTLKINKKEKKENWTMQEQVEVKSFTYTFADFGL